MRDQRNGVAAVRVTGTHDILVFSLQRSADNVRVVVNARLLYRQVHGDDLMAGSAQ